jgi:cytochrome c oxidase cbb3-type subunit 3
MCLPFRIRERVSSTWVLLLSASLAACVNTSEAPPAPKSPASAALVQGTPVSNLFPAAGTMLAESPLAAQYANDEHARSEGARLFDANNCSGCHFHGAGGIGPSLMDNDWIYGGGMQQIYASITQGRPNGMPSWGGKLSPTETWQLAAYVHNLPASNPAGAASEALPPLPPVPDGDAVSTTQSAPAPAASTAP